MPRLFTAIELPSQVREYLADLRMPFTGARWIEPDDLHITLRFAGDIDNVVASEFRHALAGVEGIGFQARVAGLGVFGGNQPRTLWAGIEAGPELEALARANERAARNAGLAPDRHGFKAHVTLARLKHTRAEDVARVLEALGAVRSEPFLVGQFMLMSSRPQVGGGPYVVEEEFPLGGFDFGHDASERW